MKGDVFVKKIYGILEYLFLLVFISGCAQRANILILQEFWNQKEVADKDSMKFVTGLEIIFPKEWCKLQISLQMLPNKACYR